MENRPELTVAIPTFGRERVLVETVTAVLDAVDTGRIEVVVADQTPQHEAETEQALSSWEQSGACRRLKLERPSLTEARNRLLREARAGVVLFLDDDVRVPAHLFERHLKWYGDASVAAVTGQVYNCLDPERPAHLERPREGTTPHSDVERPQPANNISGGNHSVRREAALAVGGFDTQFLGAALGEDLDFSQRLILAGYTIQYDPEAWIIHLGVPTGGCGITGSRVWPEWSHAAGLCLYAFRHGFRQGNFISMQWMALRNGPLRGEVIRDPLRWLPAWLGWGRAMVYGWRRRQHVAGLPREAAY